MLAFFSMLFERKLKFSIISTLRLFSLLTKIEVIIPTRVRIAVPVAIVIVAQLSGLYKSVGSNAITAIYAIIPSARAEVNIDDVVVVIRGESHYVHRVVRITGNSDLYYQTKGDANEDPDVEWVKKSDIIGKVTSSIPTWWMITPLAYVVFTLIPFGFLVYKQFSFIKKLLESEESNIEILDTTSLLLIGIIVTGCIKTIMLVWG